MVQSENLVIERWFTIVGVPSLGGNLHMWERGSLKLMKVTLGWGRRGVFCGPSTPEHESDTPFHSHPQSPEMFLQLLFYRKHNITHNQTLRYDRKLRKHFNLREIGNFGACLYKCTRIIVKQFSIGLNEMNVSLLDIQFADYLHVF